MRIKCCSFVKASFPPWLWGFLAKNQKILSWKIWWRKCFFEKKKRFHLLKSLLYENGKPQNKPVVAGHLVEMSVNVCVSIGKIRSFLALNMTMRQRCWCSSCLVVWTENEGWTRFCKLYDFVKSEKFNGSGVWKLCHHFRSFQSPCLQQLIKKFTSVRNEPNTAVLDYITQDEDFPCNLRQVCESFSEQMFISFQKRATKSIPHFLCPF